MLKKLISPCGGNLIDLIVPPANVGEVLAHAKTLSTVRLSERAICDLELLAVGAFSPLDSFMGKHDYERVVAEMRLHGGHLFPIPITLPVSNDVPLKLDREVALVDSRNETLAVMTIEEIYDWNLTHTAHEVFGTTDERHPLIAEMHRWGKRNISGRLRVLRLPMRTSGVSGLWPYEAPVQPEIVIETVTRSAEDNARVIIDLLAERGFIK